MLAIPIDAALEKRLAAAAARIGETPDVVAARALQAYLEDLEDYARAVEAMTESKDAVALDEMKRELGLDR